MQAPTVKNLARRPMLRVIVADDVLAACAELAARPFSGVTAAAAAAVDMLARILPGATVLVARSDPADPQVAVVAVRGPDLPGFEPGATTGFGAALATAVISSGEPRVCPDISAERAVWAGAAQAIGLRSYLALPLALPEGVRAGALCAVARERDGFDADALAAARIVAAVVSQQLALERARSERDEVAEQLRRQSADLLAIANVARELTTGPDARRAVCEAACDVHGAAFAELWEPAGPLEVGCTAAARIEPPAGAIARDGQTLIATALRERQRTLVPDVKQRPELWQSLAGRTAAMSVLAAPVMHEGEAIGVLVLGWRRRTRTLPEHDLAGINVLTSQAAGAIERDVLLGRLEALALTDRLTGLPNRRLWEETLPRELARARRSGDTVTVALVDLDHFRAYNDEHGRTGGDRLLKEAAASWRACLRDVDLLARHGGAQFAVLLPNCELEDGIEVVDRVRSATPRGETCSGGVATWDGQEFGEALIARAQKALSLAKHTGRDRTVGV
jgi:diguanylate cyclase (GGDEF)-like protein